MTSWMYTERSDTRGKSLWKSSWHRPIKTNSSNLNNRYTRDFSPKDIWSYPRCDQNRLTDIYRESLFLRIMIYLNQSNNSFVKYSSSRKMLPSSEKWLNLGYPQICVPRNWKIIFLPFLKFYWPSEGVTS